METLPLIHSIKSPVHAADPEDFAAVVVVVAVVVVAVVLDAAGDN